ncbi:pyridoxal-phosphate dependent enzyme [Xanthovirga aplysinae]|uniref:pyridoxal-phosphate dependent enzyme n=1 Tax=Xanthovirga aplysinae TaxID=2529853 RepID=UPI0012BBF2C7|nr:pyridoxal-phosphate dependent enzyme [Xanthovirga aplysinae]MTI30758.1 pyridoxal-phosphate dependent enzyme [Xanthovirga aplysinae]
MKNLHIETPLIKSLPLSGRTKKDIFLKLENIQPSGSFKIRGLGHLCQTAMGKGVGHFISSSGGNAGCAAAYAGSVLKIPTTVFVPTTTSTFFINYIKTLGAEVKVVGEVWDETHLEAKSFSEKMQGLYIPPFNHPLIWEGHASMIEEVATQMEKPDLVVVSVGGGGLFSGVVKGLQKVNWKDVPVLAVETRGADSFSQSLKAGKLITLDKVTSIAKSLGAKTVAKHALELTNIHPVSSLVVDDSQAIRSCIDFTHDHRYMVEPACGASLSVAYNSTDAIAEAKSVLIIVCGGLGFDLDDFCKWNSKV